MYDTVRAAEHHPPKVQCSSAFANSPVPQWRLGTLQALANLVPDTPNLDVAPRRHMALALAIVAACDYTPVAPQQRRVTGPGGDLGSWGLRGGPRCEVGNDFAAKSGARSQIDRGPPRHSI